MVKPVLSLGCNGVQNYLLLRISAIIMLCYGLYLLGFWLWVDDFSYVTWSGFFSWLITKLFTIIALLCVLIHGWIGMWQLGTDVIRLPWLRLVVQVGVIVLLIGYFLSVVLSVWSV